MGHKFMPMHEPDEPSTMMNYEFMNMRLSTEFIEWGCKGLGFYIYYL